MVEVSFTIGDQSIDLEECRDNLISACKVKDKVAVAKILDEVVGTKQVEQVLNLRNKCGTTPLHEACMWGAVECIPLLLRHGKEANVFDTRGYAPIHCAAYSNHTAAIKTLLDYHTADAHLTTINLDQGSAYQETPLHVACLRGNLEAVEFLCGKDAQLDQEDAEGNNLMHFISSSNSRSLWAWSLGMVEEKENFGELLSKKNKHGQTAAHVAASMGSKTSVGALAQLKADFDLQDSQGQSAKDIMLEHGHTHCYYLATGQQRLDPLIVRAPSSPNPIHENIRRSHSIGSGSPKTVRRGSFTGVDRPRNLTVLSMQPSAGVQLVRRGSSFSLKSGYSAKSNDSLATVVTVSKENLNRIKEELQEARGRQHSISSENAIMTVLEQTAYAPPFQGVHYTNKAVLTPSSCVLSWDEHGIKFVTKLFQNKELNRLNNTIGPPSPRPLKDDKLEVCLAVTMMTNVPIPAEYTIVSPVCFISCKYRKYCQSSFSFTLPHAVENALEIDKDSFKILSMITCDVSSRSIESPVTDYPPDVKLEEICTDSVEVYKDHLKFRSVWSNPSLFVVAMRNEPSLYIPRPLPVLRCVLFCVYQMYDEFTKISVIPVKLYVGMMNKTVQKVMKDMCARSEYSMEELHFSLREECFHISADVSSREDWAVESGQLNELRFSQVALTRDTDQQPYTHELSYPPHKVIHVVPQLMEGPASCEVTVQDSQGRTLGSVHFLPYSPFRSATHTPRETPTPARETSTPAHTSPHFQDHQACDELVQHDNNSDNALPPKLALSSMSSQLEPPLDQAQSSHKPAHSSSSAAGTTSVPGDCDRTPSSSPNSSNSSTSQAAKSSSSHKPPPYGGPQQSSLRPHPQQSSLRPHPQHHNPARKTSPASAHIPSSMV